MNNQSLEDFFNTEAFAVVGASADRNKYGNKVLRCYMQHHKTVYPVHPYLDEIEGLKAYVSVLDEAGENFKPILREVKI